MFCLFCSGISGSRSFWMICFGLCRIGFMVFLLSRSALNRNTRLGSHLRGKVNVTTEMLTKRVDLPIDWKEQESLLGFKRPPAS